MSVPRRVLAGLDVSAIGLGCMGMSAFYGSADQNALATIDRAIALGCRLLDTAEIYRPFTNEELVGRAIAGRRDEVQIATKFGVRFAPTADKPTNREIDGSSANVRRSSRRLHKPVEQFNRYRVRREAPHRARRTQHIEQRGILAENDAGLLASGPGARAYRGQPDGGALRLRVAIWAGRRRRRLDPDAEDQPPPKCCYSTKPAR
jgi:hypothetical protein